MVCYYLNLHNLKNLLTMFLNVRYSCLKITLTKLIVKFDFSTDTYTHNLKWFYYLKLPKDIQTFKDLAQSWISDNT